MGTHSTRGAARLVAVLTGLRLAGGRSDRPRRRRRRRVAGRRRCVRAAARSTRRAHAATLELYALESELRRVQGDSTPSPPARSQVAQDRAATHEQLEIAAGALDVSESQLASARSRSLRTSGQGDPLAVLLSAESLDEALAGLDSLSRAAGHNNRIIEQAREARKQLAAARRSARCTGDGAGRTRSRGEQRVARLAATAAARRSFAAGLRHQQGLNAARIAAIEAQAQTAEQRSAAISPPRSRSPRCRRPGVRSSFDRRERPGQSPSAHRYSIQGRTSTGMQTGRGRCRGRPRRDPARNAADDPGLRRRASQPTPAARCTET